MKQKKFPEFREKEAIPNETVCVSLSFALKRNFLEGKLGHPTPHHSFEVNLWGIETHNYNFLSFCDTKISRPHIFRGGQDDHFATFKTKIGPLQPL